MARRKLPSHVQEALDAVPVDESRLAPRAERLELRLPCPPVSTNHLYATVMRNGKPVRVKTKPAKDYTKLVVSAMTEWRFTYGLRPPGPPYSLVIHVYPPARREPPDTGNCIKLLEDSIFEAINKDSAEQANDRNVEMIHIRRGEPEGAGRVLVVLTGRGSK